jgi:thiamine-phosphate pyrophosphorylase
MSTGAPHEPGAWLMVITDQTVMPRPALEARIEALCAAARPGRLLVQVRDGQEPARARLDLARALAGIAARHGQRCLVNDRCDLARLSGVAGVHLGEGGIATAEARRLLGADVFVSRAAHDPARLDLGADAVVLSPVVEPRKGRPALGPEGVQAARARLATGPQRVVLFALGGVTAASARVCLDAGADGVAVIGAALAVADPEPLLRALELLRGA